MSKGEVIITKGNGEQEPFKREKLVHSLKSSGASQSLSEEIAQTIAESITDGMSTEQIYKDAFALLKKREQKSAARYSVRRAIFDLGPSGFPFEEYVARLFEAQGYTTETGKEVDGACVWHEMDVLAHKDGGDCYGEVKFHHKTGIKSDTQVSLYVKARFDDIDNHRTQNGKEPLAERWLITNTKFTSTAMQYGECAGLSMLGWNYPKGKGLQHFIEQTETHPITCLTSVTEEKKADILKQNLVLCKDTLHQREKLKKAGLSEQEIGAIVEESKGLCPSIG